jgi:hypothetical protein
MSTQAYDKDYYAWAMHNAELLRQGRLGEIDSERIAEELEDTGAAKSANWKAAWAYCWPTC